MPFRGARVATLSWALSCIVCGRACTVYQFSSGALATQIQELSALVTLLSQNGTFFLKPSRTPSYACTEQGGFLDYFSPVAGISKWSKEAELSQPDAPCQQLSVGDKLSRDGEVSLSVAHNMGYVDMCTAALPKVWRLKGPVRREAQENVERIATGAGPYVGFHVTATDAQGNAAGMMQAFSRAFPAVSQAGRCVVTGASPEGVDAMAAEARRVLSCSILEPKPLQVNAGEAQEELLTECLRGLEEILELNAHAHLDYFVGDLSDPTVAAVDLLRHALYGKPRSSFVSSNQSHPDWYQAMRAFHSRKKALLLLAKEMPASFDDEDDVAPPATSPPRRSLRE